MRLLRRRKYIVNRDLQISLLRNSFLYVLLFVAVMGVVFFVPLLAELTETESASERTLQVGNQIRYLYTYFWPAVILAMILIFLHSVRASHKVAGPLYRFKLVLEALKEGEIVSNKYPQRRLPPPRGRPYQPGARKPPAKLGGSQQAQEQLSQALSEYRRELGQNPSIDQGERVRDLTKNRFSWLTGSGTSNWPPSGLET